MTFYDIHMKISTYEVFCYESIDEQNGWISFIWNI